VFKDMGVLINVVDCILFLSAFVAAHTNSWYVCLLQPVQVSFYTTFMIPTVLKLHIYMIPKASAVPPCITQHGIFSDSNHTTLKLTKKELTYIHTYICYCKSL